MRGKIGTEVTQKVEYVIKGAFNYCIITYIMSRVFFYSLITSKLNKPKSVAL